MNQKIMVTFKTIGTEFQAEAHIGDEPEFLILGSSVTGTIEETLGALHAQLPDNRFMLTCIKCGNSESREFSVNERTGVCEWCDMTAEQQNAMQKQWARDEEYVFGPPDVDYPPERPSF